MTDVILASSRDASCIAMPNTRGKKKVHVAVNVEMIGGTIYREPYAKAGDAACDPGAMPLDMSVASPAHEIHPERRCRRRGCASRWPEYQPPSDSGS
jgi:hypothetical protein